jgi:hypothetical protein
LREPACRIVTNEIVSYQEMCQREGLSLQKGMNFRVGSRYSIILMSVRPNAPYHDRYDDDGTTIIYEGHDAQKRPGAPDPKSVDQPDLTPFGQFTENGKFYKAAQDYKQGLRPAEQVKVYEKIRSGIWSYNGKFQLSDSWQDHDGRRMVFKFKLVAIVDDNDWGTTSLDEIERRRVIPTSVKLEVWKRDGGKCVICGAKEELHFDHIIPFSRGGTSLKAENVQLLCARHNLEKHDKIE